jgi:hypothetical protein
MTHTPGGNRWTMRIHSQRSVYGGDLGLTLILTFAATIVEPARYVLDGLGISMIDVH